MDAKESDNDAARRFAGRVIKLESELTTAKESGSHWFDKLAEANTEIERLTELLRVKDAEIIEIDEDGKVHYQESAHAKVLALKQMQLDYESGEHKRLSIENAREREKSSRLLVKVNKLIEALIWCGGSADFAPYGKAREGWCKIQQNLLTGTVEDDNG